MKSLDINEVSKLCGLPASTLRYYEEKGLITSIGRRGLRRVFGQEVLERLSLVALGRSAGFSLDEIAEMYTPTGILEIDREQLEQKADSLDRTIKRLEAMRDGLRHAAQCKAPSHLECPTFKRLLEIASKHASRQSKRKGKKPIPQ